MRRTSARTYWDADGTSDLHQRSDREGNLSPRSPLDGDHLLAGGGDSRNWNDDDMFRENTGGVGGAGVGSGIGAGALPSDSMEAGENSTPKSGSAGSGGGVRGGGGSGASPREREQQHRGERGGGGGHHAGGNIKGDRRGGRRIFLRIHKFVFQKELALHFSMCILSIAIPFSLSGSPWLAAIPVSVWCFYNAMFVVGAKRAGAVLPGFDRFKRSFVAAMEEFLPPRLVPVLSLSFLSVVIAVTLTAARLGGPPLCISTCRTCLGSWRNAHPVAPLTGVPMMDLSTGSSHGKGSSKMAGVLDGGRSNWGGGGDWRKGFELGDELVGETGARRSTLRSQNGQACGYANGKELLAYYTVSQSAILIYLAVMTGLLSCLAWKVSDEELAQRQAAESRLKGQNPRAFELRERMILEHGRPGSSVRPETTMPWLMFGLVAACTFTLIGWRKWGDLPPNAVTAVVIGANVTTTLASVLMLHVGFHGRLIALYQGNLQRVQFLSKLLREGTGKTEEPWVHAAEAWWFLRSFVLREDLSLDYDVGGLGVSATFFIVLASFVVAVAQIFREGLDAMLNPPGSYCAYASVYLTVCLIRIFGLATKTYLEQQLHVGIIQEYSDSLASVSVKVSSSTAKKGGQGLSPLSPKAAVERGHAIVESIDVDGATVAAAAASGRSQQSAIALARVAVTGTNTAMQGIGGNIHRDGGVDVSVASVGGAGVGVRDEGSVGRDRGESSGDDGGPLHPQQQAMRRMVSHMSESDPYPCVLGIPVKPALFATSKVYVFVCFAVISIKLMYDVISGL